MAERLGVKLAGVNVVRVSGHNARFILENGIGPGAIIGVTRSGEVIPKVVKVIKKAKPQMPDSPWKWNENKVEAVQKAEADGNDTGKIKAIAHFFAKGLEVDGVGEGVVAQLYEAGYDTVRKILRMRLDDYMALDGWQERKSKNIYQAIKTKCQGADLIKAMAGSGILGPLLGERKLTSLFKQRPSLFDMSVEHTPEQITAQLRNVEGFKDKSAAPIIANMAKCFKFLQSLPITFKKAEAVKVVGKKMAGQQVVFTGVRSKEAELEIAKQGGTVASSVSAKTTLLVAKDPGESSSKLEKARSLGVKIVSLGQLNKLLGI